MKTKIKSFILWMFFFFFWLQVQANLSPSDGVTPLTSGIKFSYYEVTWCSPHAQRVTDQRFKSAPCQKGYFNNVWWVGKMTYKWENFSNGNVALNTSFIPSTRTAGTSFIDFFSWISSVSFEGEWVYTIRILLVDHAYNASKFEFSYKIDKTAPQFQLASMSEAHSNIYVDSSPRLTGLNGAIVKYDSVNDTSNDPDKYTNPLIDNYIWDDPDKRTNHTRTNLYSVYFKELAAHPFNINVTYDDAYNGHMQWWASYTAWADKFDLLPETGDTALKSNISLTNAVSVMTQELIGHSENSQKKYRLRLYDKTLGKSWGKSNYSEIIFYAVRDNTKPNRWTGLASTDIDAIKRLVKFEWNTTAWDEGATWNVSKFISAKINQPLLSLLQETWIIWASNNPAWYNAGVPLWWGTKIAIEQATSVGTFVDTITYSDRFNNNNIQKIHNFSQVDNNRQNGYRKYQVRFNTNWIPWNDQICDNVWNCINPELAFRVVANTLATNNSNISLSLPPSQTKVFANGTDAYNLTTQLKDAYGNAIVWVTAAENGGSVIKTANITFNFANGLHYDQLSNIWSKWAVIQDLLSIKNQTSNIGTINNNSSLTGTIFFEEKPESWTPTNKWDYGTYKFSVASKVPSVWAYPYLKNDSTLKLTSINPKAVVWDTAWVGIFWDIWLFDTTQTLPGSTNFLATNIDFLNHSDYTQDITEWKKGDYGTITLQDASGIKYDTLTWRKIEFDFASPAVYGAKDFSLSHLINNIWATQNHTKLGYRFAWVSWVTIFEQYLPSYTGSTVEKPKFTPGIFNIYSNFQGVSSDVFSGSKINNGDTISIANDNWMEEFKTKSTPIQSNYQIAWHGFNMGYISSLVYTLGGENIKLPSISRNISNNPTDDVLIAKRNSRYYFPDSMIAENNIWNGDYVILGDPIISPGVLSAMWIAITGMSNSEDLMIVDQDKGRKANLNVWENLTRYDMIKVFKQNVEKNSRGTTWCTSTIPSTPFTISNLISQTNLNNCTIDINGEKISFIKWNVDIQCAWEGCVLDYNTKRTIIVKDGSTYINSNISTYGKNSQLVIGTIADAGLKNITIPDWDNPILPRNSNVYGWTFIDPKVTNIDAFIVSQWPMVSYDGAELYNAPEALHLKNQLHIYGSTLSLNTIWWYKSESDSKCPYIVENCNQKNAFLFDLVTLRRYSLIGESASSSNLIPSGLGMRSWMKESPITSSWNNPVIITSADTCSSSTDSLRCITDTDYIIYPLFVERDVNASKSPSVLFKIY